MIWNVHLKSGSRIRIQIFFHPGSEIRIPISGVKKAPDPGSRIRIRNTAQKTTDFRIKHCCSRTFLPLVRSPGSNIYLAPRNAALIYSTGFSQTLMSLYRSGGGGGTVHWPMTNTEGSLYIENIWKVVVRWGGQKKQTWETIQHGFSPWLFYDPQIGFKKSRFVLSQHLYIYLSKKGGVKMF